MTLGIVFCIGILCFLGGSLVVLVRFVRARAGSRMRQTFTSGPGLSSLFIILLGAVLTLAGGPSGGAPPAVAAAFVPAEKQEMPAVAAELRTVADTTPGPDFDPTQDAAGPANTGQVVQLNPAMDTTAIERAIAGAPHRATVAFAAGAYNLTRTISVPCSGLHLTGPAGASPAATLSASFKNNDILAYTSGCPELGSIRYLHFENTGAVYVGGGNNANFVFEHNLVTNLPSGLSNGGSESGLFFDGSLNTTLSNILIRFNTFGDDKSCTAVFSTPKDEGGYCSGIITSQGENNNVRIEYNKFFHVENGVHFNQLAQWAPGKPNSVCISCEVSYNYVANYHRIGIEIQTSTPTDAIMIEHNAIVDPIASSWGTFAISMACCQWGRNFGEAGTSPGYIFNDNVLVASLPVGSECPPYGVEFWGNGSQGMNSLVQGKFCHGYTWGFGAGAWAIYHNYICGPDFTAKGGYITDQQKQGNPPRQQENVVAAKCVATPSTAPTISPAAGAFTGPQQVTIRDKGLNTGVWYTTDGSSPVPGEGTTRYYTGPFSITSSTVVKAVGMWGSANQPLHYPQGYGYIASTVVSASYTVTSGANRSSTNRRTAREFTSGL